MNVLSTQPHVCMPTVASSLAEKAPPGARTQRESDCVELHSCSPATPDREQSHSITPLKKTVLAVAMGLTGLGGLINAAPAYAAQPPAQTQTLEQDTLKVVIVPTGTPRVDLILRTHQGPNREVEYEPYSEVGVYLGNGLFHDSHGNLSYLPTDGYGWTPVMTTFQRMDLDVRAGRDHNASRFGSTVHFNESSTNRHIFTQKPGDVIQQLNRKEKTDFVHEGDSTTVTFGESSYTVTRMGDQIRITQPGKPDVTITEGVTQTLARQGDKLIGRVTVLDEGRMTVESQRGKSNVMRSAGGAVLQVDGRQDFTLIREADGTIHTDKSGGDHFLRIDSPQKLQAGQERFKTILDHLEATNPGYAEKHPLIISVLEYAAHNPDMLDGSPDAQSFLQAGTQVANAGGAAVSGVAMIKGATALSLAERAHALGAAALSAKAAAEAAAHAGNLSQAAAMAGEARALGAQAKEIGAEAMKQGKSATNSAQVAQVLLGVAATLEIVDGAWGIHEGAANRSLVEGAVAVTQARYDELKATLTGADLERATEDYSKVMTTLQTLEKNAKKQVTVGGLKMGCGSLLLISALMGPEAPVALGAAGIACTVGTSVYEHWDKIEGFFDQDKDLSRPTVLDILPNDEIVIKLDNGKPIKVK